MMRKLRILLIDDDDPEGSIGSIQGILNRTIVSNNYGIDFPDEWFNQYNGILAAYPFGERCLKSNVVYDLVLLDIRLENRDWGGSELLDAHWQKIGAAGSKVILYSGKPDAIIAYEPFKSGRGPFLFLRRSGQQADEDELSSHIVRLLRDRVKSLCQRASLKSSIALTQAHSREEAPTGPMDALTHSAIGKPQYSEAARTAKQDLESLACGLNDRG